jgi:recombinational DNA repair protein (RecF pathway)
MHPANCSYCGEFSEDIIASTKRKTFICFKCVHSVNKTMKKIELIKQQLGLFRTKDN